MKLNINYGRPKLDKPGAEEISDSELTVSYINFAINSAYKDGVDGQIKRIIGRLQTKLDEAKDDVELESAEIDLLKKCFDKVKVPTNLLKYWILLEDEIEKLK